MKQFKPRTLAIASALLLAMSLNVCAFASNFADMPDDWSRPALEAAVDNGLLAGDAQGRINAHAPITRAELAAVVVRAYGAASPADLSAYTDLVPGAWYHDSLAQAVRMGALTGNGALMEPDRCATRQEAIVALARVLDLEDGTAEDLAAFEDADEVEDWAVGPMAAMVKAGYVSGSGGRLEPAGAITRAQFAQVMNNVFAFYIREPGVVTEVPEGNVIISADGVTLKDVTVTGDLIIGDGVGEGEAILDGVTVEGDTLVRGGGENTVVFNNCTLKNVKAKKNITVTSPAVKALHIKFGAGTTVAQVEASTENLHLETDVNIKSITVNAPVVVRGEGTVNTIQVNAPVSVKINVSVTNLVVIKAAVKENAVPDITVGEGGKVEQVEGEGKDAVTITGEDGNEYKPQPPATPAPVIPDDIYYPPEAPSAPPTDSTPPTETTPPTESVPSTEPDPPAVTTPSTESVPSAETPLSGES